MNPDLPSLTAAREICERVTANIRKVIRGQDKAIRRLMAAMASGGHVLLEDYPGTGKTTLAKTLALSIEGRFKRIQFTPDLLPSDVLGVSIYNQENRTFEFHEGPVFTNILLADEINRASPRTQSALLEAMGEGQVSIEGEQRILDRLFFVLATQNPVEFRGTYPLPEAQMDRFAMQFALGYVDSVEEVSILSEQNFRHPILDLKPCASTEEILKVRDVVATVAVSEELKHYIVRLTGATRSHEAVKLGASPRASIALMKAAQALALLDGQDFVGPEHIRELAADVMSHRLVLDEQAQFSGLSARGVVEEVLRGTEIPG